MIEAWQNLIQNYVKTTSNLANSMYQGVSKTLPNYNNANNVTTPVNNNYQKQPINNAVPSYYFPVVFIPFFPLGIIVNPIIKK